MSLVFSKNNTTSTISGSVQKPTNGYVQVVILFIIISIFYWFLVKPKQAQLSEKQVKLDQINTSVSDLDKVIGKLKGLISQVQSSKQEIAKLEEALPTNGKTFQINQSIVTMAEQSGVSISSPNISPKGSYVISGNVPLLQNPYSAKRELQKLTTSITVIGSFPQLFNYLKKLESSPRFIYIKNVDIVAETPETLNMSLTLETYYYE